MGNYKLVGRAGREDSLLDLGNDSQNVAERMCQKSCHLCHSQEGGTREAATGTVDLKKPHSYNTMVRRPGTRATAAAATSASMMGCGACHCHLYK